MENQENLKSQSHLKYGPIPWLQTTKLIKTHNTGKKRTHRPMGQDRLQKVTHALMMNQQKGQEYTLGKQSLQ